MFYIRCRGRREVKSQMSMKTARPWSSERRSGRGVLSHSPGAISGARMRGEAGGMA